MIKTNYDTESADFKKTFDHVKNKKIVLYGIGRYTATLMTALTDYHIIGFMDRDPENIGKQIYGLPILSKEQAEEAADLIIINTVPVYWDTIYKRIQDINIPVCYRNGQKAEAGENQYQDLKYWETSETELMQAIAECDIISFDIFDTLLTRQVYLPKDVYSIVETALDVHYGRKLHFRELREKAAGMLERNTSSLDEIYGNFHNICDWDKEVIAYAKAMELAIELKCMAPRKRMIDLCGKAKDMGKLVFFLSDMYLPMEWYKEALGSIGIEAEESQIWISNERKTSKQDGTMWKVFQSEVVKGRKALHIGDDIRADDLNPTACDIWTYPVKSGRELLGISSMQGIVPHICTQYASVTMGLIVQRVLNDPFVLNHTFGRIRLENAKDFGYCVYGPVLHSFLLWLLRQARSDHLRRLFFMARDGYFLLQDYNWLVETLQAKTECPQGEYLLISRRVVSVASIRNEDDFKEICEFPYYGTFEAYMDLRFDIKVGDDIHAEELISLPGDLEKIDDWMKPYKELIEKQVANEKEEYCEYIGSQCLTAADAIVDTWYYGNTQYYLSRLLGQPLTGYYFAANLTPQNKCLRENRFISCFQSAEDLKADACQLFKKGLVTESFLTAPYGMIKKVYRDGTYSCCGKLKNQETFSLKEGMNEGVKEFIKDFWNCVPVDAYPNMDPDPLFSDCLFGYWMNGGCDLSEKVKSSFWSDNEMVQKREFQLFE